VASESPRVCHVTIQRMDHVGVVVDDLEAAIAFFVELGMELDGGTTPVEGDWVDRVVGLDEVRVEIAFVRTPDGYGRLELTKFHNPMATTLSAVLPPRARWHHRRARRTGALPARRREGRHNYGSGADSRVNSAHITAVDEHSSACHEPALRTPVHRGGRLQPRDCQTLTDACVPTRQRMGSIARRSTDLRPQRRSAHRTYRGRAHPQSQRRVLRAPGGRCE
jgi:catechol 2,3-dioxygenase-like lactoylglutathione lyase family enzyme